MVNQIQNQYLPDYVSPPGETLLEKIEELRMTQAELARRMGRHKKTVNEIIQGKAPITPETALQLERVLGIPASFWNNRELHYRQYLAQKQLEKQLGSCIHWLEKFPVKDMIKKGWIQACGDEIQQLNELLNFFGVSSPEQWNAIWDPCWVAFRKTRAYVSDQYALSAWLRRGEIEAQGIHCQPYSTKNFRLALEEVRHLTLEAPEVFQPETVRLCAEAGVAVVFVPQLPKTRTSGATRWLAPDKAMIQLSLRYRTDDHLWFTFFHEAGHILLHGKREAFLEGHDENEVQNQEADAFAARTLIPPAALERFLASTKPGHISKKAILEFSAEIGIAPGIVVGRLQYDGYLPYTHCNKLKRTLTWVE